jgi:hypothetical protein
LACDDEYVTAALNAHYDKVAKVYRDGKVFGRSYLEKIVQIQFRLPLLRHSKRARRPDNGNLPSSLQRAV